MRKPTPKPANSASKPKLVAKVAATPATPDIAPAEAGVAAAPMLQTKIKDLVDRIAAATGQKPKDVRDVAVATLAELGKALDKGELLNLPPLGKIKVNRSRELDNGASLTLKLRRGGGSSVGGTGAGSGGAAANRKSAKVALVEAGEDS